MATPHRGAGYPIARDNLLVEDPETTGMDKDNDSISGSDVTVALGGLEAEDNTNEPLPNNQAKLMAPTREINDLHQWVEAEEGQPAESLECIEWEAFLQDALSRHMGTATTKHVSNIKNRINQLITAQHTQQETLVHIISTLNVTRYATQVSSQDINIVMDTVESSHQDITTLYNITSSLYNSLSSQQIILYIYSNSSKS